MEYDWRLEGGLARSRMADRQTPQSLKTSVDWLKELSMSRELSVGDEQQWKMRFHVASATPADELLQRISKGIDGLPDWARQPDANRWTSDQEGRRVTLSLDAIPGTSSKEYQMEIRVSTKVN